ncbi:MAG: pantoate--beta-alanine ligase [Chloroflexota bacterium]|nr:pantoate--beta-alanine ligase [Chloroflexota bacterium]
MRVAETVQQLRSYRATLAGKVGLVPTMGYLHEGHLSLVRKAAEDCDSVVVSIFVNPAQFGAGEDLTAYPRDLARDLELLAQERVDVVLCPSVEEMYPEPSDVSVEPGGISARLEGAARPGHFRGVATVVAKLLNLVQPHAAYFGRKDAQQLAVLQRVVRGLHFPVEVVGCPTVREPDGLALSSRNVYLTPVERRAAPAIYRALREGEALYGRGERDAERLKARVREILRSEPLLSPEYVSVADPSTLEDLVSVGPHGALLSLAARLGRARLIDNVLLPPAAQQEDERAAGN